MLRVSHLRPLRRCPVRVPAPQCVCFSRSHGIRPLRQCACMQLGFHSCIIGLTKSCLS